MARKIKCVKIAFKAAVEMRKGLLKEALAYVHKNPACVVQQEEYNLMTRGRSSNAVVWLYIEELEAMDDMIRRLSRYL
jgi:hypothetical protein